MEFTIYKTGARIDTGSAPAFEKELNELVASGVLNLKLDMEATEYLSSVGLRVLLSKHKELKRKGGKLVLQHVGDIVNEVFEVTGFAGFLTIE